jgi:hypothetical protein
MALFRGKASSVTGRKIFPDVVESCVVPVYCDYVFGVDSPTLTFAAGDIIDVGYIPGSSVLVDAMVVFPTAIEAASVSDLSFGLLNAAQTDLDVTASAGGAAWFTALQNGRAASGGGLVRLSTNAGLKATATSTNRAVGFKVVAGFTATAGTRVRALLFFAADPV